MFEDPEGRVRSLPTAWTSLSAVDPYVRVSAGRSLFRTEDLVALVSLIRQLSTRGAECKGESAASVNQNTPDACQDIAQ